jgi:hypothetical protein
MPSDLQVAIGALERIAAWVLPSTRACGLCGHAMRDAVCRARESHGCLGTLEQSKPSSYAYHYGSNGERDYMKAIAQQALDQITR